MSDVSRTVVVGSRVGLHSRPAKLVAQEAAKLPVVVKISKDNGTAVDARSLLSMLALGAKKGDQVTLTADGDGADGAVDALATLIEQDLDEADV
ncbi:MAG TPA: HPr family phosphocarrier protein [Actinomycetota bacterium]|jgi:phosphocarrier protein|nr:HPr family phosphocarrier protein [Actinomycetota bacterium]